MAMTNVRLNKWEKLAQQAIEKDSKPPSVSKKPPPNTGGQKNTVDLADLSTVNRSAMARALEIDLAHASRILTGKVNPSMHLAIRVVDYLNLYRLPGTPKITVESLSEVLDHLDLKRE